jgi:WD40 repeat protein
MAMERCGERQTSLREMVIEARPDPYFTGRAAVLGEIVRWLKARRHDGKALLITGSPGSGKSAVLARLVTLSDPEYRRQMPLRGVSRGTIPPEDHIVLTIDARQKTLWDCLAAITTMVGTAADDPELIHALPLPGRPLPPPFHESVAYDPWLLDELPWRGKRWVILLDHLDEAIHPQRIAREILGPLSSIPTVRLLVGADRELLPALDLPSVLIDVDDARYAQRADLVEYVRRRLLATEEPGRPTPYRDDPGPAAEIAEAVGEQAYPVFLIARLISESLIRDAQPVDRSRPGWREQFPSAVANAFDRYLDSFGSDRQRVRDLLLPLAYAEWNGLPREDIWAPLASALSGVTRTEWDVEWLMDHAGALTVEGAEDGRPVYRLAHRVLAEHLRLGHRVADAQRRITNALSEQLSDRVFGVGKDWLRASPYVTRHLAAHAAQAGMLADFVADPLYLVAAEPSFLFRALDVGSPGLPPKVVEVYRRAIRHRHARSFPEQASYLEMVARQSGMSALADQVNQLPLDRVFSVPWTNWQSWATRCGLDRVSSLAVGELDGRPVIISGHGDGTVRLWDLSTGRPLGEPLRGHKSEISSVAVGELEGRPVIVSGSSDETVRRWDLSTGRPLGEPLRSRIGRVDSVTVGELEGRPVIVSEGTEMTVRAWDLATGRPLIVSDSPEKTVRMWDPASGRPVGRPFRGDRGMSSVVAGRLGGRPVIVSEGAEMMARAWDLATGRPLIVSDSLEKTVRMWDPASGRPAGEPFRSRIGWIDSVTMGELEGRPVIVSEGAEMTVRTWDLATDRSLIVSASPERTGRMWDPASGRLVGGPFRGHQGMSSVAVGELEGRPAIVIGGEDGTVRVLGESGQLEAMISVWDATAVVVALAPGARIVVGALGGLMVLRLNPDTFYAQTRPSHDVPQDITPARK